MKETEHIVQDIDTKSFVSRALRGGENKRAFCFLLNALEMPA